MAAADIKVENDGDSSSALPNGQNKEEASSKTAVVDDAGVPAKKIKTENGEGYVQCSQLPQWMMTEMEICEIVACGFIVCLVLLKA